MRGTPTIVPWLVAGLTIFAAGCDDSVPTQPPAGTRQPGAVTAAPSVSRGIDGEFLRLSAEIHGFGGMYFDESGKLNVYVKGARGGGIAKTDIARRLSALDRPARGRRVAAVSAALTGGFTLLDADYDFAQLAEWHGRLLPLLALPGVVFTDIDESQNRLRVGVEDDAARAAVEAELTSLDVPADAVVIDRSAPITFAATLRDRVRPIGGGLQITFANPDPRFVFVCTLGFSALRLEVAGHFFVTNSHCTFHQGGVDPTVYWQPLPGAANVIGREIEDPPYFSGPPFCPFVGRRCRFSDASIAMYEPDVPVQFGTIMRTTARGTTVGSIDINEFHPRFYIVDEGRFPVLGQQLDKVGRTTGWTTGPTIATCINVGVSGTDIVQLCQDAVQAGVGGGDSGSPVFDSAGGTTHAVLYGILWGGSTDGQLFIFSAMENIEFELGELITTVYGDH